MLFINKTLLALHCAAFEPRPPLSAITDYSVFSWFCTKGPQRTWATREASDCIAIAGKAHGGSFTLILFVRSTRCDWIFAGKFFLMISQSIWQKPIVKIP